MKTLNVMMVLILVSSSLMPFSAVAEKYYDPNAGDSASNPKPRKVEIHKDKKSSKGQQLKQLGQDAVQFGQGLLSGDSEDSSSTQIPIIVDKRPSSSDSKQTQNSHGKSSKALDDLFDQEVGASDDNSTKPNHTVAKRKASSLDDLMEQEQQDESHQRQVAEENRRAEESRQRQIAEEKFRREENDRRVAAQQREREQAQAREAAADRERDDNKTVGWLGAAIFAGMGHQNMAEAYLNQATSGESNDAAINSAMVQDKQNQIQKMEEDRRRQEEAQRQQAEESNHRIETYNKQQATWNNQQQENQRKLQDQQRQDEENQRAQMEDRKRKAALQEQLKPVNSCITTKRMFGSVYLFNNCSAKVEASWRDQGNCSQGCECGIAPYNYTSCGGGVKGSVTLLLACESPAHPSGGECKM
jgi:DNA repair exonuclease SbcCD ATPase subunit